MLGRKKSGMPKSKVSGLLMKVRWFKPEVDRKSHEKIWLVQIQIKLTFGENGDPTLYVVMDWSFS